MTRNIDELNNLNTRAEDPEEYFGKMDLPKKEKQRRVEYTKKANEIFDLILVLILLSDYRDEVFYASMRSRLEGYLLSLIAEFTTPDDYLIDYATDTAYNFIEATKKNESNEWFLSSDRALYNAENSANDVLNYDLYIQAIEEGKTHKRWINEKDNRVRESHRNVEKKPIPIKDFFRVGLARMRFPKDYEYASMFPEELVNCRCSIEYLSKDKEEDKKADNNIEISYSEPIVNRTFQNPKEIAKSKQNRVENNINNGIIKIDRVNNRKAEENKTEIKTLPDKSSGRLLIEAESPFANPKTPLKIYEYDQSKHFKGGKKYLEYISTHKFDPSYLTISLEKAQELVNTYHGTGTLKLNRNGDIIPMETIIDYEGIVGKAVNDLTGKEAETSAFVIIYSNKGTHIAPAYMSKKRYLLEKRKNNGYDWLYRQKS